MLARSDDRVLRPGGFVGCAQHAPSQSGTNQIEAVQVAHRGWGGGDAAEIGMSIVGAAEESAVELVGAPTLRPGIDVIDVAAVGRNVASRLVAAIAVADLDRSAE